MTSMSGLSPERPRDARGTLDSESEPLIRAFLRRLAEFKNENFLQLGVDPDTCDLPSLVGRKRPDDGNYLIIDRFGVGPGQYTQDDYTTQLKSGEMAVTVSYGDFGPLSGHGGQFSAKYRIADLHLEKIEDHTHYTMMS